MENISQREMGEVTNGVGGKTVAEVKERWSEFLFALSAFFGLLHFVGIAGQVGGMFFDKVFDVTVRIPFKSSQLMGNIYLAFLAAYVGRKEFVRWFDRDDVEGRGHHHCLGSAFGDHGIVS